MRFSIFAIVSCICLCKDTNFKANHNKRLYRQNPQCVVYAYAKILILKQITTASVCIARWRTVVYAYAKILILKQITTSSSISSSLKGCICLCKDTNFKANHNNLRYPQLCFPVVYAYAKILILKQITTFSYWDSE